MNKETLKKILRRTNYFFIFIFIILFYISNTSRAYEIDEYYLLDPYTIKNYDELVELYDNLRGLYEEACEENASLERTIKELNDEIEQKKEEISQLKEENSGYINRLYSNDDDWKLIFIPLVIFGIPFFIYYIVDKKEQSKRK